MSEAQTETATDNGDNNNNNNTSPTSEDDITKEENAEETKEDVKPAVGKTDGEAAADNDGVEKPAEDDKKSDGSEPDDNMPKTGKLIKELDDEAPKTFPQVLMDILSNEEDADTIAWLPHGRSFIIYKKKRFATHVLPRFFKATKFTSFTRKLNRWGFTRVTRGPEMGSYYHKLFVREDPSLCLRMSSHSSSKFHETGQNLMAQGMPFPGMFMPGMPMPGMPMMGQMPDINQQNQLINQQLQQLQWQQFQLQQLQQQQHQQHPQGPGGPPPMHPHHQHHPGQGPPPPHMQPPPHHMQGMPPGPHPQHHPGHPPQGHPGAAGPPPQGPPPNQSPGPKPGTEV